MDNYYRRRGSFVGRFKASLILFWVHCILSASAWPSELGYSKVVTHNPSANNAPVLPDLSRVHQARELNDAHPLWFPRT